MDPSLTPPAPEVEEDEWDTDGFVIPSLNVGDSDLGKADVLGVTDPKPPPKAVKEAEKIYLGPHGAPPSQAKQQELNAAGRKQRFKRKLKEADHKFSGMGRENRVETLRQLVGSKMSGATVPKSSFHESQFETYRRQEHYQANSKIHF